LLGIASQTGVPSALFYSLFIISFLIVGFRSILLGLEQKNKVLLVIAFLAFSIFVFQQFRGLLQDTWNIKEQYFWIGVLAGVLECSNAFRKSKRVLASQVMSYDVVSK